MDRDLVLGMLWFMRRNATWTGNRFDFEVQGIKFSIQRRGRKNKISDKVIKYSDSYLTRGDHAWKIIIRNYNYEDLPIIPPKAEIDFRGDYALFEHDYIMLRMFGEW